MPAYRKGEPRRPRCGRRLQVRRLADRVREYDFGVAIPVCGLPAGHEKYSNCLAEETVTRGQERKRERERRKRVQP